MAENNTQSAECLSHLTAELGTWRTMHDAPKDGTQILGFCVHEDKTTDGIYECHSVELGVCEGMVVIQFGGGWDDRSWEDSSGGHIPDWWFRADGDYETVANPKNWMPLPKPPTSA